MKFSTPLTLALTMVFMLSPTLTEARIGSSSSGVVVVEDTVSVLSSPGQQQHRELSTVKPWISKWQDSAAPGVAPPESSCLHYPHNLTPTIKNHYYCAVSDDLFQNGDICGQCFEITYTGYAYSHYNPSNIPDGTPGSAIIQVINSGAGNVTHFDCLLNGYKDITGLITDGVEMTYKKATCPQ